MSEYLTQRDWEPKLPITNPDELVESGRIIAPHILLREIERAKNCLRDCPGPNIARRRQLAGEWYEYWSELCLLSNRQTLNDHDVIPNPKVVPYSDIPIALSRRNPRASGLITYGAGEGMPHHVYCPQYMEGVLNPNGLVVVGLEPDAYMKLKTRLERFVPLTMLISMYALLSSVHIVTIMPFDLEQSREPNYYMGRFLATGIDYSFGTAGEPHAEEQAARRGARSQQLPAIDTLIPRKKSYPTSSMVGKLWDRKYSDNMFENDTEVIFDSEWLKR